MTDGRVPKRQKEGITERLTEAVIRTVEDKGATFEFVKEMPGLMWGPAPWCSRYGLLPGETGGVEIGQGGIAGAGASTGGAAAAAQGTTGTGTGTGGTGTGTGGTGTGTGTGTGETTQLDTDVLAAIFLLLRPHPGDRCLIGFAGPDRIPWIVGWWSTTTITSTGTLGSQTAESAAGGATNPNVPTVPIDPNSPLGQKLIAIAKTMLGKPYLWGGASPATGFDCSGLIMWAAAQMGISIPHNSAAQYNFLASQGKSMSVAQALVTPGALLYRGPGEHVAISLGDGVHTLEAHQTGQPVEILAGAANRTWTQAAHL